MAYSDWLMQRLITACCMSIYLLLTLKMVSNKNVIDMQYILIYKRNFKRERKLFDFFVKCNVSIREIFVSKQV
jgi:hypothetical protein